ncbi:LOW QUALITY PROTEIN: solute-binding protein, partial [Streptomyces sviceus ATCC 29083]
MESLMSVNKPSAARETGTSRRRAALLAGAAATVLLTVTACGGGGGTSGTTKDGFAQAAQNDGALTVWVDATRMDAAKQYQASHPGVKMDIVSYDGDANGSNYLQTKVQLFNRTGKGWPDVVFSSQNNEASWAVDAGFAAPLNKGLIPDATLGGFAKGANDVCTVGRTLYCLRNDLSQAVLWYNAPLLKKFGYTVPTTWEDYQALGEKVAKEHPGYLVGDAGDSFTPEIYLWASKCGANHITGPKAVSVNTTSEACTKMAKLLDVLIKNKSMSISGVFSTDFAKNEARQGPAHARPGLVRRRGVQGRPQDPGQADRGGAHTAVAGRHLTVHRQRRRRHLAAVQALRPHQGGHRLPEVGHHRQRLPGREGPRLPGLRARRRELAQGTGRLRLLRQRPQRPQGRLLPGVVRLGLGSVQPGGDLGRHRQAGHHPGQDHRLDAARLAGLHHQVRQVQRIQGLPV